MDDRLSYFNRLQNINWDRPHRGLGPRSQPPRLHDLEQQVYVLRSLLLAVVPFLIGVILSADQADLAAQAQAPGNSVSLLGMATVGGLLFWAGVGLFAARLWWPAYFCGLLGLTLSVFHILPMMDFLNAGTLFQVAGMGMLIGAAAVGGHRFRRW
jgi:hypothetical protein